MAEEHVYRLLCTHYLTGTCKFEQCIKLHPKDIAQAKAELSLKKRNPYLCCKEEEHNPAECLDLHISDRNPLLESCYIDDLIKGILQAYNKKLSTVSENLKRVPFASIKKEIKELEIIKDQLSEIFEDLGK